MRVAPRPVAAAQTEREPLLVDGDDSAAALRLRRLQAERRQPQPLPEPSLPSDALPEHVGTLHAPAVCGAAGTVFNKLNSLALLSGRMFLIPRYALPLLHRGRSGGVWYDGAGGPCREAHRVHALDLLRLACALWWRGWRPRVAHNGVALQWRRPAPRRAWGRDGAPPDRDPAAAGAEALCDLVTDPASPVTRVWVVGASAETVDAVAAAASRRGLAGGGRAGGGRGRITIERPAAAPPGRGRARRRAGGQSARW